jgi:hypothetical protein
MNDDRVGRCAVRWRAKWGRALVTVLACVCGSIALSITAVAAGSASALLDASDGDLARKADIMHGDRWQRAISEFRQWLVTQRVYSPAQVRRIKSDFNARVAGMSSYELDYLLDSLDAKLRLLDTPEARDAKAWLGEYLSVMSDARRAEALRGVPNILDMTSAQLWDEIVRIDRTRANLRQRQQGVEQRQQVQAERAASARRATAAASQAAAARRAAAPSHSPYRHGGGSPPHADIAPRRLSISVGPMGACVGM